MGEPAERKLKSLLLLGSVFRHKGDPSPRSLRTLLGGDLHLIKKFLKRQPTRVFVESLRILRARLAAGGSISFLA